MNQIIKKIAVTGGNGFIGNKILESLIEQKIDVLSLQRSKINKHNVEIKKFELTDVSNMTYKILCDVDVVIHAAAHVHHHNSQENEYKNANFSATKNLFELCKKAKVKKFIFLSSVSVYGLNSSKNKINLNNNTSPNSFYGKSKLMCEDYLLNTNNSVKVSIIRLPLVYGDNAPGNFGKLQKIANTNLPLPFLNLKNKRSMIDVNIVASVICKIALNCDAHLGLHLLCEKKPFSTEEIISRLRGFNNKSARLFSFPIFIIKISLILFGKRKIYEQLFEDLEFIGTINI